MSELSGAASLHLIFFRNLPRGTLVSRMLFVIIGLVFLITSAFCLINSLSLVNRPFPGFLYNSRLALAYVGPQHWTGVQAGLKYPDKILKANGQVVSSARELKEALAQVRPGDAVQYTIQKSDHVVDATIVAMQFTWFDLFMVFGLNFLVGIIYFLLGVIVFLLKPDTQVSWMFFLNCVLLSLGNVAGFDEFSTHYGGKTVMLFIVPYLGATLCHTGLIFPERVRLIKRHPYWLVVPYAVATGFFLVAWLQYPKPLAIATYSVSQIYEALGVLVVIVSSLLAYGRSPSVLARARSKVVLLGAAFSFPLPSTVPIVSSLGIAIANIPVSLANIPLIVFPAAIGYAIARHNLFDVDVYIKRAVGYVMMTAIVALAYFSLQTLISTVVLRPILGENAQKVYPILFALLVVFLFNPVNRRVQDAVDKMFFRKKFDYKQMVASVSNALNSLLNLNEIIKLIIHTVRQEIFIDAAGVILLEPQKKGCQTFFIADVPGNVKDQSKEVCIPYDDPLLALLSKEKKLITKYDIAEDPRYVNVRESCGQRFSEMAASLAIPLIYQDEVKGVLALGYKKSGHFYTREDIDLLTTLANQGAVAIENAKLVEQMKKEEAVRTNLARYLSPQIVDQIIQKDVKVNLGGDRKVVTVLFSDIRNFTTITETRPPDQLVQILNEYFTEMAGIIFENQGSLDKYIGDAIVAVFGSLIPLENSTPHAVTAAIQMMKRLPILNEKWMKEYGFTMNIGIGINTGEVFLGNIGSPERMEFTVIGDTVNVASRFSGLAKPGQILITREAFNCLGPDIRYKELPPSEVKGKSGKLEVFEILYT